MSSTAQRNVAGVAEGKESRLTLPVVDGKMQTVSHDAKRLKNERVLEEETPRCRHAIYVKVLTRSMQASHLVRVFYIVRMYSPHLSCGFEVKIVILAISVARNANRKKL